MPLPFVDHVGARVLEADQGASLLALAVAPHHFNSSGVVHGAALFTLADTGMGAALHSVLDASEACATIEIKINFLRPVSAGEARCRSALVHRGRSTAMLESTLEVADKVVAKASGTFAIFPRRAAG